MESVVKFILTLFLTPLYLFAEIDFEKDIAPIFETYCISCHNDKKTKGKFNLTIREKLLSHKSAVLPGDIKGSELLEIVSGEEPDMPPKGQPLSAKEIELLESWIKSGAKWPEGRVLKYNPKKNLDWWSLKAIKSANLSGNKNPVDHFIDLKLKENGIEPNTQAEAEVLIRRLYYDLTGLPPTVNEIKKFLEAYEDNPELAWKAKVDELLSRKSFGEKWAQHWLDIARYADTHGYDKDKMRNNAWPYRDYVIRSFNEDKAYDKFIKEQIAGDVLFPGTEDGVIGLGFLAAGPWDFVGHVEVSESKLDGQIARHMDRDEMLAATFNVFMSSTVQCAQCHHHKFDPIHQEDYYRLQAVFSAIDRADRVYSGLDPQKEKEKIKVQVALNKASTEAGRLDRGLKKRLAAKTSGLQKRIDELKAQFGSPLRPQYGYHSLISKKQSDEKWVLVDLGKLEDVEEIKIYPAFDKYNNIGAGFGFPIRYKIEVASDVDMKENLRVIYKSEKDEVNPGLKTLRFDVGGDPVRSVRITALKLRERTNDYIFSLGELEIIGGVQSGNLAQNKRVLSKDSIQALPRWARKNLVDGIFHKEVSKPGANKEMALLQEKINKIRAEIFTPEVKKRQEKVLNEKRRLQKEITKFPQGKLVYAASTHFKKEANFKPTNGSPRQIHLLERGDIKSKGALMKPGVPALWNSTKPFFAINENWQEEDARKGLAEYLTSRENPLVWRSIANRLWQWTFGSPLVGSPNDFGRMGMKPTHPELLDFLAAKIRDDKDHSLKSIISLLLNSKAYRRTSQNFIDKQEIDAGNKLLWKFNRRRLSAEEFRDSLLFLGGRLKEDKGGPAFKDFVVQKPQHSPHYQYHLHNYNDTKAHRRTVYRFVVRSQPQPMLTTLDCADPSLSVPKRDESTTALQALAQWNNKLTEAMAVYFADKHKSASIEEVFTTVLGREPKPRERDILHKELNQNGLASVARILFNMSAFTYVD